MRFVQLGASLYVPATRPDLAAIGSLQKYPHLRSVIFCTEDSIHEAELGQALDNLARTLPVLDMVPLLRFVRVRNPRVLRVLLQMPCIHHLAGFVLPKVTRDNVEEYFGLFRPEDPFDVMLTLETPEAFDPAQMMALREVLLQERLRRRILSLRIGGNDLLNLLGLRRPRRRTVYATPVRGAIDQLVTLFRPLGFNLTGPVYDYLDNDDLLCREARADLAHGLFGKTAIHPRQVPLIDAQYRVSVAELRMAERILSQSAPAVFRYQHAMCEPATHSAWARLIRERAAVYGVKERRRRSEARLPRIQRNGQTQHPEASDAH